MSEVRTPARLGRAARAEASIKVRPTLARMVCVVPQHVAGDDVWSSDDLLEAELKVMRGTIASFADALMTREAKPKFGSLGKKCGEDTLPPAPAVAVVTSDELSVKEEEDGRFSAIDRTITIELRREGIARELVSGLQRLRRHLGFAVSDRIRLWIAAPDEVRTAVTAYHDWIANELLAREITLGEGQAAQQAHELDLDGSRVRVALTQEL